MRRKKTHNFMQQQGNSEKLNEPAGKQEARDAKAPIPQTNTGDSALTCTSL